VACGGWRGGRGQDPQGASAHVGPGRRWGTSGCQGASGALAAAAKRRHRGKVFPDEREAKGQMEKENNKEGPTGKN